MWKKWLKFDDKGAQDVEFKIKENQKSVEKFLTISQISYFFRTSFLHQIFYFT